jgi:hypothetical protein
VQQTKTKKITKRPENVPNDTKCTKWGFYIYTYIYIYIHIHIYICNHFQFQGPPKFTQVGNFGMLIYHLATLLPTTLVARRHETSFIEMSFIRTSLSKRRFSKRRCRNVVIETTFFETSLSNRRYRNVAIETSLSKRRLSSTLASYVCMWACRVGNKSFVILPIGTRVLRSFAELKCVKCRNAEIQIVNIKI